VRITLDTNVLACADGVNGAERKEAVNRILLDLGEDDIVIPAQALAEPFPLLTRKSAGRPPRRGKRVIGWHDNCLVVDTSSGLLLDAMEQVVSHKFALWEAIMLAAAAATR
jgi:predicted nucleic acid-binding protein